MRDLVRGANVARVLGILLAFDIPGDGSLGTQALHVDNIGLSLPQYARLERSKTRSCVYIEIGSIVIAEVSTWVIGKAARLMNIAGGRAGEKNGSYGPAIGPMELRWPGSGPTGVSIGGQGLEGCSRGCKAQ